MYACVCACMSEYNISVWIICVSARRPMPQTDYEIKRPIFISCDLYYRIFSFDIDFRCGPVSYAALVLSVSLFLPISHHNHHHHHHRHSCASTSSILCHALSFNSKFLPLFTFMHVLFFFSLSHFILLGCRWFFVFIEISPHYYSVQQTATKMLI